MVLKLFHKANIHCNSKRKYEGSAIIILIPLARSTKYIRRTFDHSEVIDGPYPNHMPDIMNLAQAVLQIFCSQGYFTIQYAKVGKGR